MPKQESELAAIVAKNVARWRVERSERRAVARDTVRRSLRNKTGFRAFNAVLS